MKTEKKELKKRILLNYLKQNYWKCNQEDLKKKILDSGYTKRDLDCALGVLKADKYTKEKDAEEKKYETGKKGAKPELDEIKNCSKILSKIKKEIGSVLIGQEKIVDSLVMALLCDGHVLIEGVPGLAKTLAVKAIAKVSGCESNRIQFTVDLLPTDIVGFTTYTPEKGFEIIKGPVFANFIIADEINRAPPKCVLGDTPIIMENGMLSDIKEIIREYNGKETYKKNNEYWIVPKKKLKLLSFDYSDFKIKPEEVRYLYKQKTSEPYHEIKLKSGRKIKTSGIHPFFTTEDGKVKTIKANELKKGNCVLIPRTLPVSGDNKLSYNKKSLEESRKIQEEIKIRKKLYKKVQDCKRRGVTYKEIAKKLKVNSAKKENLIKTFFKIKPKYLNYEEGYFFSKSKQFGQIRGIKKPDFVTKELARFTAILIAEANVNKSYFYLSMKEEEIPKRFIEDAKKVFNIDINLLYDKKRAQHRIAFRSDSLVSLLKAIGYDPHLKAGDKSIPKFILTSKEDVMKEFLRTYYDCDGCVSRDCIKVTTKSKKIANSLSYLLLREGFVARISRELCNTKIGNYSYKRRFYNLRLYGGDFQRFSERISFLTEKNIKKLINLTKNQKRAGMDLIPGLHQVIRNYRKENKITHKQFYELTGMHAHNLENPKNSLMHSCYRLKKIAEKIGDSKFSNIRRLINGDFYCDFVKENKMIKPKKDYWLYDFSMKNKHSFVAGFGGIISHNTQSALIEAMQEKQVTIGKTTFKLPLPFFVMATENPLETSGVYTLPEAQIDRFLFKIIMKYPKVEEEVLIMEKNVTLKKFEEFKLRPMTSSQQIIRMQDLAKKIYLNDKIRRYILKIVEATRIKDFENGKYIDWGASPRASIALFIASKARALIQGRNFVIPRDVKECVHEVLRHRIILTYRASVEGITSDKIVDEILEKIRVP